MPATSLAFLDPSDPRWIDNIEGDPQANIFHHPAWSNCLARSYGFSPFILALLDNEERVAAGFPVMDIKGIITGHK